MQLTSEAVVDYFLQSTLAGKSGSPDHHDNQNNAQSSSSSSSSLRERARYQVSTSVFRSDDAATLRTSPNWALNSPFLFQRWLFTVARRSVLAMRCYQDIADDPARSEWVKLLESESSSIRQQVSNFQKKHQQQQQQVAAGNNNNNNNSNNTADTSAATAASHIHLEHHHYAGISGGAPPGSGGFWCKRRSIWRAAHEKSRVELPQAIVSALNPYETAELQHFGAAMAQLQQTNSGEISNVDAVSTFAAVMHEGGVELNELGAAPGAGGVGGHDFCKRVARRWKTASVAAQQKAKSAAAPPGAGGGNSSNLNALLPLHTQAAALFGTSSQQTSTTAKHDPHSSKSRRATPVLSTCAEAWPYDTNGVIWRDVFEAVRFVLACPPSAVTTAPSSDAQDAEGEDHHHHHHHHSTDDHHRQLHQSQLRPSSSSVVHQTTTTTSANADAEGTTQRGSSGNRRPPVPTSATSSVQQQQQQKTSSASRPFDSAGALRAAIAQSQQTSTQHHSFNPVDIELRRAQLQQVLEGSRSGGDSSFSSSSPDDAGDARLQACSTHWIRTIAAVVISVCFGDIFDSQAPGSKEFPEITPEFVREVLSCVLEIVSAPSSSLLHEKCVTTLAAFLEFQKAFVETSNNNNDDGNGSGAAGYNNNASSSLSFFSTEVTSLDSNNNSSTRSDKQQQQQKSPPHANPIIASVLRRSPAVAPPWWWFPMPPFVTTSWSDVDSADIIKTFAVAFPSVSMIPGYMKPFEVNDRARLEDRMSRARAVRQQQLEQRRLRCARNSSISRNNNNSVGDKQNISAATRGYDDDDDEETAIDQLLVGADTILRQVDAGLEAEALNPGLFVQMQQQSHHQHGVVDGDDDFFVSSTQQNQQHPRGHSASSGRGGGGGGGNVEYVDQVTRRRIERLRHKHRDEKIMAAMQKLSAPPRLLVSPSLSRLTAAARGHRHERVYTQMPMLPLSEQDDAEAAQLELSLQKKSHDWVKDQRPKFMKQQQQTSKQHQQHHESMSKTPDAAISVRPWFGSAKKKASPPKTRLGGGTSPSSSPPKNQPQHQKLIERLYHPQPAKEIVASVIEEGAMLHNSNSKNKNSVVASSVPWCVTNALKCGGQSLKQRQLGTPLGTGTVARQRVKVRALAETLQQHYQAMYH